MAVPGEKPMAIDRCQNLASVNNSPRFRSSTAWSARLRQPSFLDPYGRARSAGSTPALRRPRTKVAEAIDSDRPPVRSATEWQSP